MTSLVTSRPARWRRGHVPGCVDGRIRDKNATAQAKDPCTKGLIRHRPPERDRHGECWEWSSGPVDLRIDRGLAEQVATDWLLAIHRAGAVASFCCPCARAAVRCLVIGVRVVLFGSWCRFGVIVE